MRPAIDLIAKQCGVSKTTVSRVLNNRPYVKEEIQKRVIGAMRKLKYSPRQMSVKMIVAIAVSRQMGLYEGAIISGIASRLLQRGIGVRIQPAEDLDLNRTFDVGCLIDASLQPGLEVGNKGAKGIPCITFNNVINGCHSVRSDHAQGLELGLKKLSEMGHKRIAFVLNNSEGWGNSERVKGYQQGIRKHRLVSETGLLQQYEKNITEALAKCLLLKPTAIIVSGEDAAIEANYAVKVLGRRIPEDISLVTFEHAAVSRHMFPPNSTISQDLQCMAEAAADLAAAFLEGKGPKSPKDFIFKNSFIERESTRHLKGTRQ